MVFNSQQLCLLLSVLKMGMILGTWSGLDEETVARLNWDPMILCDALISWCVRDWAGNSTVYLSWAHQEGQPRFEDGGGVSAVMHKLG